MNTAEQNYRLLQEIEENRRFMLMAYQQNPKLLEHAEVRIKQMFEGESVRQIEEQTMTQMTKQRGISLIELIMFIVIVSVALAGILLVMNVTTKGSADPMIHKQALTIAESLLEEVELMPFTYCDPDDPNAATATTSAGCTGGTGGANDESKLPLGPEGAGSVGGGPEGRYAVPQFDNVSDYNDFNSVADGGIKDISGAAITALSGYSATVSVAQQSLGGIAAAGSLLITVTVTGPDNVPITLEGYRTRYAPNSLP